MSFGILYCYTLTHIHTCIYILLRYYNIRPSCCNGVGRARREPSTAEQKKKKWKKNKRRIFIHVEYFASPRARLRLSAIVGLQYILRSDVSYNNNNNNNIQIQIRVHAATSSYYELQPDNILIE